MPPSSSLMKQCIPRHEACFFGQIHCSRRSFKFSFFFTFSGSVVGSRDFFLPLSLLPVALFESSAAHFWQMLMLMIGGSFVLQTDVTRCKRIKYEAFVSSGIPGLGTMRGMVKEISNSVKSSGRGWRALSILESSCACIVSQDLSVSN